MNADLKKHTVLLVDDHELILNGLIRVLECSPICGNISGFCNAQLAVSEIKRRKFDIYIIDIQLKEMSGFELISAIRHIHPYARIIVVTMHEEIWTINRLMEIDVDGIVLKSSASEHIIQAVNSTLKENHYLCPHFNKLKNQYGAKHICKTKRNITLTTQEKLVLKYIIEGLTSRQMAEMLSLSENTIETHRKNLFIKLDVRNVAQLVAIALHTGIVNDNWS